MTTVEDLYRWDQSIEQGTLAGKEFSSDLLNPGRLNNGRPLNYAFGLTINTYRGLKSVSHGGSFIGFKSELLRLPERRLSVICLCNHNSVDATDLAKEVAGLYLGDVPGEASPASSAENLERVPLPETDLNDGTSVFRESTTGSIWRFSRADRKLTATVDGQSFRLKPLGNNRFRSLDAPIDLDLEFQRPSPDQPFVLQLGVEGQSPIRLEAVKLVSLSADQLLEFAANYYSPELQAVYQLFVHEGKLFLRVKNRSDVEVLPVLTHVFRVEGKNLTFSRDQDSRITGFVLSSGRIRNLRFSKERSE